MKKAWPDILSHKGEKKMKWGGGERNFLRGRILARIKIEISVNELPVSPDRQTGGRDKKFIPDKLV